MPRKKKRLTVTDVQSFALEGKCPACGRKGELVIVGQSSRLHFLEQCLRNQIANLEAKLATAEYDALIKAAEVISVLADEYCDSFQSMYSYGTRHGLLSAQNLVFALAEEAKS